MNAAAAATGTMRFATGCLKYASSTAVRTQQRCCAAVVTGGSAVLSGVRSPLTPHEQHSVTRRLSSQSQAVSIPPSMKAMVLTATGARNSEFRMALEELRMPQPGRVCGCDILLEYRNE